MSANEKLTLVPLRRFPEFLDAEKWESKQLGQLITIGNGRDYKHLDQGDIPVYGSGGYMLSVNDYLHDGDSVCIGRKGTINSPMFLSGKFWAVDTLFYTHSFKECVPRFIFLHFQNIDWLKHNEAGGVPSLSKSNIQKVQIAIPKICEQQKIADCMSSLDDLISAQTQKLAALKSHKTSFIQQLFPSEGETVPRLRFPEFCNKGDWSKVAAGEIFSNRIKRGTPGLPIYSVTMTDGMVPRASLARKIDDIAEVSANKTAHAGDIVYNMMRMWQGALGVAPEDCMVSPAYIVLTPQHANPIFFHYLLKTPKSLRVLTTNSRGLTEDRLRLYYDDFSKITLQCPTLKEQDRIAEFLMSLDRLIANQEQNIGHLKTHKKGLLQQLLPPNARESYEH